MKIQITEPFLPPFEDYLARLQGVWERNWLTNDGPLVQELEGKLKEYLGVEHLLLVSNGTVALQIAVKALGLEGEVITTPFSHISTTSTLAWEGCRPRHADIDPRSWNLDPQRVEEVIGPHTSGIVATHVYGNPCDVEGLGAVAEAHGLKLVYDAAHCFGSRYSGRSVLTCGDVSAISFHATKIFHTVEGGALVTTSPELHRRMAYMRNFGHDGPGRFNGVGVNGKMSEIHAAMGLCNLQYADAILSKRRSDCLLYDAQLCDEELARPSVCDGCEPNHAYYPVLFPTEERLLAAVRALEAHEIFPRRYFHPSLASLDYVSRGSVPVADDVATRVLCLPLSYNISEAEIERICALVRTSLTQAGEA